jgi:hypothetical protein
MSYFAVRSRLSNRFAQKLFIEIEKLGFTCALNGTEYTHPTFVNKLRQSTDQTSLAIRFQPDGVACIGDTPKSFYIEAKNSKSIERLAYEQYIKLYQAGNTIVVVFGKYNRKWQFIQDIKFINSYQVVAQYPVDRRFPIKDGWISPRSKSDWKTLDIPMASGTDYKEVDPTSLYDWIHFPYVHYFI